MIPDVFRTYFKKVSSTLPSGRVLAEKKHSPLISLSPIRKSTSCYNIPITVDTRISVVPTFRTPSPFVSLFINTPLSNTFFLDTLFQM